MHTRGHNAAKQAIAEENRARVQRRRAEQRFMAGISSNYEVEHLQQLREDVANEERKPAPVKRLQRERVQTQPDTREGFTELKRYGKNTTCVEVTQGGATVWAATDTGSIEIRSGSDGQLVHTVTTVDADVQVTAMSATDTHMWVGLSDGTVQVYDFLVFLHITEGKFHTAPVTSFCHTFDGRTFSGSEGGVIVRWDMEVKSFEAMSKISTSLPNITGLAAHNYRLYATSSDGQILCLDVENAAALSTVAAHDTKITAAVTVDGSLFTAGDDGKIQVWSCQDDTPVNLATVDSESPVIAFAPDTSSHRLLIGHEDGTVDVMRTSIEDNFSVERTFTEYKGRELRGLKAMTAVDSLKIWSLASNGVNKVWFSSRNKVAGAMEDTIDSLKAVMKQDTIELDKWRTLVFRLKCINARRKIQMTNTLALYHNDLIRRRYQWQWRQFLHAKKAERRRIAVSDRLAKEEHIAFVRRIYNNWYRWFRYTQNTRLKTRYANLLQSTNQRNTTLFYFRKMQAFARHVKLSIKRRHATKLLGEHNQTFFLRTYYRRWLKFRHQQKAQNQKVAYAKALFRNSNATLRRMYYMQWLKAAQRYVLEQRRKKFGETLMAATIRGTRLTAFQKWAKFAHNRKSFQRKLTMAGALIETTNRGLMAQTYAKWLLFRARQNKLQVQSRQQAAEKEVEAMRAKYAQLQHIIDEKKALDALKAQLAQEKEDLEARQLKYDQLQIEKHDLSQQIADRDFEAALKARSVQEQMMSLMANLKAKVINFHTDFSLMSQIREKLRSNAPVTKVFLEAHQQVKRVVVDLTKQPHLQQEEWPLSAEKVKKMPAHSLTVLLTAIKTMIITFDVMDAETRNQLQSDSEIVMNAKWLMVMAEHCVSYRKKTLGHK